MEIVMPRIKRLFFIAAVVVIAFYAFPKFNIAHAATYPGGFSEVMVAGGLNAPISLEFAPDGRLFVTEKGGTLRIIKNGILNPVPFATIAVDASIERGLLGVTIDPDFDTNHFVYIHYVRCCVNGQPVGRVSRLTASWNNPDVMEPGSEKILIDNIPSQSGIHDGGELHMGDDKKLYVAVGDGGFAFADNSQNLTNLAGKILRINTDGTIPADNPFVGQANIRPEIYAYGLRNPFSFSIEPGTGRVFLNEVGWNSWEEINVLVKGGNYGWPQCEGACNRPGLIDPLYQYDHNFGHSVTGGAFYHGTAYPAQYNGDYFFADYTYGFIKALDFLNGNTVTSFGEGVNSPVNLKLGPDGLIYYVSIYSGTVNKVQYQPQIPPPPPGAGNGLYGIYFNNKDLAGNPVLSRTDSTVNFDWGGGSPSGNVNTDLFSARWTGQVLPQYSEPYTFTVKGDDGVRLYVNNQLVVDRFVDQAPTETSGTIQLQAGQKYAIRLEYYESLGGAMVQLFWQSPSQFKQIIPQSQLFAQLPGQAPLGTIVSPVNNATYNAGDTINYSATAADPEDGVLPDSAFSWSIIFHHDQHTHPFLGPIKGVKSGSFSPSTTSEPSANTWYEVQLTVTDSSGQTHQSSRMVYPNKSNLKFETNIPGLNLTIDNQTQVTPYNLTAVVGFQRSISAPLVQTLNGKNYEFVSWSDNGAASHTVLTPDVDTTYTATYKETTTPVTPPTNTASVIKVFAAGTPAQGVYPILELLVDDQVVATFTDIRGDANNRQFIENTYNSPTLVTPERIKIRYPNDVFINNEDRNVRIDKMTINGAAYEVEDPTVYSTGTWDPATNCAPGNKKSEWLQCGGYIGFAQGTVPPVVPPVVPPTPPPTPNQPFTPAHLGTTFLPQTPNTGKPVTITASIKNNGDAGAMLVDIEVYKDGNKVSQQFFDNSNFAAGETKEFTHTWTPGVAGNYTVSIGLFKPGWASAYNWLPNTKEIVVTNEAPNPPSGTSITIYTDALANNWQNWSWDTDTDFGSTAQGSPSIKVAMKSAWAGFFIHTDTPVSTANLSKLTFAINGGQNGGQSLKLLTYNAQGTVISTKEIASYIQNGIQINNWSTVTIPLADIQAQNQNIIGFAFQGTNGQVQSPFFIDNLLIL